MKNINKFFTCKSRFCKLFTNKSILLLFIIIACGAYTPKTNTMTVNERKAQYEREMARKNGAQKVNLKTIIKKEPINKPVTAKKLVEKMEQINKAYFSDLLNTMKISVVPGKKSDERIQICFDVKDLNFSDNFIKECIKEILAGQIDMCKEDLNLSCKFLSGFDSYLTPEAQQAEDERLNQLVGTKEYYMKHELSKEKLLKCKDETMAFYVEKIVETKRPIVSLFAECPCMDRSLREIFENKIINNDVIKTKKTIKYMSIGSGNLFQDLSMLTKLIKAGKKIDTVNIIDMAYGKQEKEMKRESVIRSIKNVANIGIGYINNENDTSHLFIPVTQLAQFTRIISEMQKLPVKVIVHENFDSYETMCKEQPSQKADLAVAIDFSSRFSIIGFGISELAPKVFSESNFLYKVTDKFDAEKCESYDTEIEIIPNKKMHQKNEKLFVRIIENVIGTEGVFGTIRKKTDEGWEAGNFFETIFVKK